MKFKGVLTLIRIRTCQLAETTLLKSTLQNQVPLSWGVKKVVHSFVADTLDSHESSFGPTGARKLRDENNMLSRMYIVSSQCSGLQCETLFNVKSVYRTKFCAAICAFLLEADVCIIDPFEPSVLNWARLTKISILI